MSAVHDLWVIKYGGNAMTDATARKGIAEAIGAARRDGRHVVVVHGGGPMIAQVLAAAGIESRFVRGLRVTDERAIAPVEAALTMLGKQLAQEIGGAVGLTGRDAQLLTAEVADAELGRVGRMTGVDGEALHALLDAGFTPVVACLAMDAEGRPLNVNADEVAGAVAGELAAPVAFLTDVPGVLDDPEVGGDPIARLTAAEVRARIADGRIAGGMIPKVEAALTALERGSPSATILDGRLAEAVGHALQGRGGTRIVP